jgi:hypothetical protein
MAKVITYNVVNGDIRADGGTALDPITLTDIADEDTAQGWGVFTKYGDNVFLMTGRNVEIGSQSASFFTMVRECLVFDNTNNGRIQIPASPGTTGDITESVVWGHQYPQFYQTGKVEDSCIHAARYEIEQNVVLRRVLVLASNLYGYSGTELEDVILTGTFAVMADPVTVDGLICEGINFSWSAESTLYDIEFLADSEIQGGLQGTLVDSDSSNVTDWESWGEIIREAVTFARPVTDDAGTPISGASVVITDGLSSEVANYSTNANGLPASETLLVYSTWATGWPPNVQTDYNDFTVVVSKTGYATYTEIVTLDGTAQEDIIALQDEVATGINIDFNVDLPDVVGYVDVDISAEVD